MIIFSQICLINHFNKFLYDVAESGWLSISLNGLFKRCLALDHVTSIRNYYLPYMTAYDDMLLNTAITTLPHVLVIKFRHKNIIKNVKIIKNIGKSRKFFVYP